MRYAVVSKDGKRCPVTFTEEKTARAVAEEVNRASTACGGPWVHEVIREEGEPDVPAGLTLRMVTKKEGDTTRSYMTFVRKDPPGTIGVRVSWAAW